MLHIIEDMGHFYQAITENCRFLHFSLASALCLVIIENMDTNRTISFVILTTLLLAGCETKEDRLIRQREERNRRIDAEARKSIKDSYVAIQKYNREDRTKEIQEEFRAEIDAIIAEYRFEVPEIEKQIRLRREEAARQKGIDTKQAELDRLNLELDYENGKINKRERDYGLMMVDQNLDQKIRNRELKISQQELKDYKDRLEIVNLTIKKLREKKDHIQRIMEECPTCKEMKNIFQQQVNAQKRIDASNRELQSVQKESEKERLMDTRRRAFKEMRDIESRINKIKDLMRGGGVNFEPSYQAETDVSSRTKEYEMALGELNLNLKKCRSILTNH